MWPGYGSLHLDRIIDREVTMNISELPAPATISDQPYRSFTLKINI